MVSLYGHAESKNKIKDINLLKYLTKPHPDYSILVDTIRMITDKAQRDTLKKKLPAITPSGRFEGRTKLIEHSGLICVDIDFSHNERLGNFRELKQQIANLSVVACCMLSVSGHGYMVLIPIQYPEKHKEHFAALEKDFLKFNISIDKACKDVNRLRFYSYDKDAYINPHAVIYKKILEVRQPEKKQFTQNHYSDDLRGKVEYCISEICAKKIDITDFYDNWLAVGCAFAYEFKEEGRAYFHSVSQFSSKYTVAAADDQYDQCLKYNYTTSLKPFFSLCRVEDILYSRMVENIKSDVSVTNAGELIINEYGYPAIWDEPFDQSRVNKILEEHKNKTL